MEIAIAIIAAVAGVLGGIWAVIRGAKAEERAAVLAANARAREERRRAELVADARAKLHRETEVARIRADTAADRRLAGTDIEAAEAEMRKDTWEEPWKP